MDRDVKPAFGPGGPRCACCRLPRKAQKKVCRAARRAAKRLAIKEQE